MIFWWCLRWDLNPYIKDRGFWDLRVCLFRHSGISTFRGAAVSSPQFHGDSFWYGSKTFLKRPETFWTTRGPVHYFQVISLPSKTYGDWTPNLWKTDPIRAFSAGASAGTRTRDSLIKSQVLYLLSYRRIYKSLIPQPKFSLLECWSGRHGVPLMHQFDLLI